MIITLRNSLGNREYEEKGEIDKVEKNGMYGERCYKVYIEKQERWENWVSWKDLKHDYMSRDEAHRARQADKLLRKERLERLELEEQRRAGERLQNRAHGSYEAARGGRRALPHRGNDRGGSPPRGGTRGGGQRQAYPQSEPDHQPYNNVTDAGRANSVPPNYTWIAIPSNMMPRDQDGIPVNNVNDDKGANEADTYPAHPDLLNHDDFKRRDGDKNADDFENNARGHYADDDYNAREATESIKNGFMGDEVNVGTRDNSRRRNNDTTKGGGLMPAETPRMDIHHHYHHYHDGVPVKHHGHNYDREQGRTPGRRD